MSYKSALKKLPKNNTKEVNAEIKKEYELGGELYKDMEDKKAPR